MVVTVVQTAEMMMVVPPEEMHTAVQILLHVTMTQMLLLMMEAVTTVPFAGMAQLYVMIVTAQKKIQMRTS